MKIETYLNNIRIATDKELSDLISDNATIYLKGNVAKAQSYLEKNPLYSSIKGLNESEKINFKRYVVRGEKGIIQLINHAEPDIFPERFKLDEIYDYSIILNNYRSDTKEGPNPSLRDIAHNLKDIALNFILKEKVPYLLPKTFYHEGGLVRSA